LNARNLYQFNAEYRNYLKQLGANVLFAKTAMMRNLESVGVKSLYNKYRFRSLKDYTLVANVFNRRNIIGFDGEQVLLHSRCKYLLAHETQKNRFSVVLNFNENPYAISLFAFGQKSIDISYNKAAIDQKSVSFPKTIQLDNNHGVITLTREAMAVCVELNNDLRICCYEDSSSCTVATTRWFTGKLNGLLGNTNKNVESIKEQDWYLSNTCKQQASFVLKPASREVIEQCQSLFGQKQSAMMKDALMAIRPQGWLKMCETVLTADLKAKCILLKSFNHFAEQQKVHVEPPKECYTCQQLKSNKYVAGQSVIKTDVSLKTNVEKGSDYVFLTMPCDKKTIFN